MGTTNGQVINRSTGSSCHVAEQGSSGWLGGHRGFVVVAAATTAAGALALSQHWLAAADLRPLLYILPCAAMMFMCMKSMNHGRQTDTAQTSSRNEATTTTDTTDVRT